MAKWYIRYMSDENQRGATIDAPTSDKAEEIVRAEHGDVSILWTACLGDEGYLYDNNKGWAHHFSVLDIAEFCAKMKYHIENIDAENYSLVRREG